MELWSPEAEAEYYKWPPRLQEGEVESQDDTFPNSVKTQKTKSTARKDLPQLPVEAKGEDRGPRELPGPHGNQ